MRRLCLFAVFVVLAAGLLSCVFYLNPQCNDLILNGTETDIDCGGTCGPCTIGHTCQKGPDCDNGYCLEGTCEPLPCVNGRKDFAETDVDCGGGTCRKCSGERQCAIDADCAGGHCDLGKCRALKDLHFTAAVSYPSGPKTYALFSGDFNGDGHIDLAAANEQGSAITMFLGRGDGSFDTVGTSFTTGQYPTGGTVADFNHDGKPDIITANYHGNSVSVLLGTGDGSLAPTTDYPTTMNGSTSNLAVGDLDGDGFLDIIATNPENGTVSQFMGRAGGTFAMSTNSIIGRQGQEHVPAPFSAAIGDFNEDGKNDVAVAETSFDVMIVRLGHGDGTFGPEVEYPEGGVPAYIVITRDMNLDGHLDLVVANRSSDNVTVLLGNGDGTFQAPLLSTTGVGTNPYSIAVADFNLDGVPDVVTANFVSSTATVLIGVGDGTFEAPIDAGATGDVSYGVVAQDLDEDGIPDIAICNATSNDVTIKLTRGSR